MTRRRRPPLGSRACGTRGFGQRLGRWLRASWRVDAGVGHRRQGPTPRYAGPVLNAGMLLAGRPSRCGLLSRSGTSSNAGSGPRAGNCFSCCPCRCRARHRLRWVHEGLAAASWGNTGCGPACLSQRTCLGVRRVPRPDARGHQAWRLRRQAGRRARLCRRLAALRRWLLAHRRAALHSSACPTRCIRGHGRVRHRGHRILLPLHARCSAPTLAQASLEECPWPGCQSRGLRCRWQLLPRRSCLLKLAQALLCPPRAPVLVPMLPPAKAPEAEEEAQALAAAVAGLREKAAGVRDLDRQAQRGGVWLPGHGPAHPGRG